MNKDFKMWRICKVIKATTFDLFHKHGYAEVENQFLCKDCLNFANITMKQNSFSVVYKKINSWNLHQWYIYSSRCVTCVIHLIAKNVQVIYMHTLCYLWIKLLPLLLACCSSSPAFLSLNSCALLIPALHHMYYWLGMKLFNGEMTKITVGGLISM